MQGPLCLARANKWAIVMFSRVIPPLPMGWVDKDHKGAPKEYDDAAKKTLNVLFPT